MNACMLASAQLFSSILSSLVSTPSHLHVLKVPASPEACAEALLGESVNTNSHVTVFIACYTSHKQTAGLASLSSFYGSFSRP